MKKSTNQRIVDFQKIKRGFPLLSPEQQQKFFDEIENQIAEMQTGDDLRDWLIEFRDALKTLVEVRAK